MLNLAMLLEDHARKRPDREAVVCGATRFTYGQLDTLACQVAGALHERGIHPGDHVALSCPNLPHFLIVYFGILKAGAVAVPLNVLLRPAEITYHLQDSDARAYFCFEGTPDLPMGHFGHEGFAAARACEHLVMITADPAMDSPIPGVETLGAFMRAQPPTFQTVLRAADDTAVVLYTSGTTGRAKGAELTHANMLLNAIASRDIGLAAIGTGIYRALIVLPLFHSFGQTCQMNAGLYSGATLVLVPRFNPAIVLETLAREHINQFSGVPTMYWALLQHARANDIDTAPIAQHLMLCTSGGAPMPVELLHAFEETFGVAVLEGYGLSETSPVATFNHLDLPRKVGSIGVPIAGVDVRVLVSDGSEAPVGEAGEIVIRGHNVMKGYYRRPDETADAFRDGWFHTGDIARRDEDGYFFIVDRLKDMILRGGFNVYPREIEETLLTHPAVSLAAVIGIANDELGEEVKAFVILKDGASLTEEELIAWCRERMASYKYPRHVEFRAELPMSATGKILKRELRAAPPRAPHLVLEK